MPFSSQPRKKGIPGPQGESKDSPCGSPVCETHKPAAGGAKVVPLNLDKSAIHSLREKIADRAVNDRRFHEKAAIILSTWLNGSGSRKK